MNDVASVEPRRLVSGDAGGKQDHPTRWISGWDACTFLSVIWFSIATVYCILAPSGRVEAVSGGLGIAITVVFVTGLFVLLNVGAVARNWWSRKHRNANLPALGLNLALFILLFALIGRTLGSHHFRCSTSPRIEDWTAFGLAHLVRAADVLDTIETYQINIQRIHHVSVFAGIVLLIFQIVNGLLVLDLLGRFVKRWRRRLMGDAHIQVIPLIVRVVVWACSVGLLLAVIIVQVSPNNRGPSWTTLLKFGVPIVFVLLLERWYHNWALRKHGDLLEANQKTTSEVLGSLFAGGNGPPLARIVGFLVLLVAVPVVLFGGGAVVIAFVPGMHEQPPGTFWPWALSNVLQALDFADAMTIFSLRHKSLGIGWSEKALALIIRAAATLILSLFVALLARWWTGRNSAENADKIPVSWQGARGILFGGCIALPVILLAAAY